MVAEIGKLRHCGCAPVGGDGEPLDGARRIPKRKRGPVRPRARRALSGVEAAVEYVLHGFPQVARRQRFMGTLAHLARPLEFAHVDGLAQDFVRGRRGHWSSRVASVQTFVADLILIPLMAAHLFGVNSLARVMAVVLPLDSIGQTCFPFLVGLIRDRSGSYGAGLGVVFALALAGACAVALLPGRPEDAGTSLLN
jgi:hypothetical protein